MTFNKLLLLLSAVMVVLAACEKDNLNQNVPRDEDHDPDWGKGDSIPLVADYYFRAKIDSKMVVLQNEIDNYGFSYDSTRYSYCDGDSTVNMMGFATRLARPGTLNNSIEIRFIFCVDDSASKAMNASKFHKGGYPFGNDEIGERETGVQITWVDNRGVEWKSRPGTGASQNYRFLLSEPLLEDGSGRNYFEGFSDLRLYRGSSSVRVEAGEFRMLMRAL